MRDDTFLDSHIQIEGINACSYFCGMRNANQCYFLTSARIRIPHRVAIYMIFKKVKRASTFLFSMRNVDQKRQCGIRNAECKMRNPQREMRNADGGMRNIHRGMLNAECVLRNPQSGMRCPVCGIRIDSCGTVHSAAESSRGDAEFRIAQKYEPAFNLACQKLYRYDSLKCILIYKCMFLFSCCQKFRVLFKCIYY